MFLSFGDQRPFYEELDIQSPIFASYVRSVVKRDGEHSPDLKSVYHSQNFIVYGNVPCGKTTQIYGYLASLFNTRSIYSIKNNVYSGSFQYKSSPFHIEFSTKFIKNTDITNDNKNIEFIRHITQTPNMLFQIPKVLYIRNFDLCSLEIQKFFLRIIEKSAAHTRFILEVRDLSKLNDAIISRFHILRMGAPRLVEDVIPLVRKVYRERRILGEEAVEGPELTDEELDHIIRHSHCENFTYRERPLEDYRFNLKAIFGNLAIYLSTQSPGVPGGKRLYVPLYVQRFVTLKELIFKTTPQNFFIHMKTIREILLEIYVNNVSSMVLQKYLYQTFVEWLEEKSKERGRGAFDTTLLARSEDRAQSSRESSQIHKFTQMTTELNYMLVTANKDVLFHELYILEMIKIRLFSSSA
jgi:hypothetical protein